MGTETIMTDIAVLLRQIADDPQAAADRLESMAAKLLALAGRLRSQANQGGTRDTGSIADRVQMTVRGPDGEVKFKTDTERNS